MALISRLSAQSTLGLALTFISGSAIAESGISGVDLAKKYELSIAGAAHHETYREAYQGKRVMQQKGGLYGLAASFAVTLSETSKVQFNGLMVHGTSDYIGSYQGGTYGSLFFAGQRRQLADVSAAYKVKPGSLKGASVGVGLGYRNLLDRFSEVGPSGYDRENKMLYGTVGIERTYGLSSAWTATPSLTVRVGLKTSQHSYLFGSRKKSQDDVLGMELALQVQSLNAKWPLFVSPFIRVFKVGDSEVVGGTLEPANKTTELGVRVGLQF